MNKIMEGVCRPLKMRVEQILVSEPGPVILYKLSNLLQFYSQTIKSIIDCGVTAKNEESKVQLEYDLLETLDELAELCKKMFFNSLSFMSQKFTSSIAKPPLDLSCNQTLKSSLILLKEILSVQDGSILTIEDKKVDFNKVLNLILDPLLQNCLLSASHLSMTDMSVYMINSLQSINNALAFYELGVNQRLEMLQAQIDAHSETLCNEQAAFVLTRGGLGSIYNNCERYKDGDDLKTQIGMDSDSVQSAMNQFDSYLSQPDGHQLPQFGLLTSPIVRDKIIKRSNGLVITSYTKVYEIIGKQDYKNAESILKRNPEQIKQLLC